MIASLIAVAPASAELSDADWLAIETIVIADPATLQASADARDSLWAEYLDLAYIYTSAPQGELIGRLEEYGREAGMTLEQYLDRYYAETGSSPDEVAIRREAIGHLLLYLSTGEAKWLETSVLALKPFEGRTSRPETSYWEHTIRAHRAMEKRDSTEFVKQVLALWLDVVVPLETPYETLQSLSLSQSPHSGFVSALPFVYENVGRMILIRSQEMGLHSGLDPLGALVRLLDEGRIGAQPEVIPPAASSKAYLARIIQRLDSAESDEGSLSFTLALFEAGKQHDKARSLMAREGLSPATVRAMGVANGAYETALETAETTQGQCAVYTRVLRQLGETWATKQRLGVDPPIETSFSIEAAMKIYSQLYRGRNEWPDLGYRSSGFDSYHDAMHSLWQEIQEASLNAADYYLTLSLRQSAAADEHARSAARSYSLYLDFFTAHANGANSDLVPDSAYFAAYEAAKGFGDSFTRYGSGSATRTEIELATERYLASARVFPFDRELWPALTNALARDGRQNEFLSLVLPIATSVTESRHVSRWIQAREIGAGEISAVRRALSDELVIMYLGFAEATRIDDLEESLGTLRASRVELARNTSVAAPGAQPKADKRNRASFVSNLAGATARTRRLAKLDKQIAARARAIPLYRAVLESDVMISDLRGQRAHPIHTLLRRMFQEQRS